MHDVADAVADDDDGDVDAGAAGDDVRHNPVHCNRQDMWDRAENSVADDVSSRCALAATRSWHVHADNDAVAAIANPLNPRVSWARAVALLPLTLPRLLLLTNVAD